MNYNNFLDELYSLQDLKYKEFNSKIIGIDNIIGVRTPDLKRIAKRISREDYITFIKKNKHKYYEEDLVQGLLLGYLKLSFDALKKHIKEFLPYINNWSLCDLTAANLKVFKKKENSYKAFEEIKQYIKDSNPWINRFGFVLLLDYFIDDIHIDDIFKLCVDYKDEYYVKMAIAWLLSTCFIKYQGKTLTYLKTCNLDDWTYNKTLQKIIESNRINLDIKNIVKGMKRK